jgi:hypothetical protein
MKKFCGAVARCFTVMVGLTIAGCSNEPRLYPVSGSVRLDGQVIADGDLLFITPDGSRGPDPSKIKDGQYSLQTTAGKKRVEISAAKIRPGGARGAGGEPVPEEYIPARYNTSSELTAEVKESSENKISFELQGK